MPAMKRVSPSKRAPGKRGVNKEKTRANILRAALALFRTKGFHRTTTKEISRKARIAEGTLFNYFKTKEDLALYFFDRELTELSEWFEREASLRDAPVTEQVFALIHRHLERIEPYTDFVGAVYLRALQPRSKLNPISLDAQERNLRYLRFVRDILQAAEDRGEIPPLGDFGAYAVGLFHLAMITYWLNDSSPGRENTVATLDRALRMAEGVLRQGGWEW